LKNWEFSKAQFAAKAAETREGSGDLRSEEKLKQAWQQTGESKAGKVLLSTSRAVLSN